MYERTGRDLRFGRKLPLHFVAGGLGEPDGTDVAGELGLTAELGWLYAGVYRSVLPAALRLGLTTEPDSHAFLTEFATAATERSRIGLCPLLISAWKPLSERPAGTPSENLDDPLADLVAADRGSEAGGRVVDMGTEPPAQDTR